MAVDGSALRSADTVRHVARLGHTSTRYKPWRQCQTLYSLVPSRDAARDRPLGRIRRSEDSPRERTDPRSIRDLEGIPSPQERRQGAVGDQSKDDQSLRSRRPLQNGRLTLATRRNSTVRLDDKARSSRRFPSPAHPPESKTLLSLPMEEHTLRVASSAVRLPRRSTSIHSSDASSSNSSTTAGDSSHSLHGRHPHPISLAGTSDQRSRHSASATAAVRLVAEQKEVSLHTNTADRLPRSDGGLSEDALLSSSEESRRSARARASNATSRTERKANTALPAPVVGRPPAGGIRLHSADTTSFQRADRGTAPRSTLSLHHSLPASDQRVAMVGDELGEVEWKTNSSSSTDSPVRHGRVGERLGSSSLPSDRPKDRVSGILHVSNDEQHSRIDGDSKRSGLSSQSFEVEELVDSSSNRQSNSDELYQPHGWSLTSSLPNSRASSHVLPRTQSAPLSRVPSRRRERNSGSAIPNRERSLRIPAESSDIQANQSNMGAARHRCMCVGIQHSTPELCQFAQRYSMHVHRRVHEEDSSSSQPVVLSSILDHRSNSEKDREGKTDTNSGGSSMVQPAMVAPPVAAMPGLAAPPATVAAVPAVLVGREQKSDTNDVVVDRSSLIRQRLKSQGFSESGVDLWFLHFKHGEHTGTNKGLNSMWGKYHTWCSTTGRCATDFKIADIICYANDVIVGERNLSANAALAFISMMSTTHQLLTENQPELSKMRLIIDFRNGLRKKKPATNVKPSTYFSLYSVFQHLRSLSQDDDKCSLPVLRNKLVTLLTIDGMARASDIASITRDTIRFDKDERVYFNYYSTKESKAVGEIPMCINGYREDKRICTVSVLRKYLTRTINYSRSRSIELVTHMVQGVCVNRSPLLISDYRNRQQLYYGLSAERVASINNRVLKLLNIAVFRSHAFRGAASSKADNLGGDIQHILARARWASDATYRKYYFKKKIYRQYSSAHRFVPIEFLLRMKTDDVGKPFDHDMKDDDDEKVEEHQVIEIE